MKRPSYKLALACAILIALGIVFVVVLPWWNHTRSMAMEKACIDNLESIDAAKQQWALLAGPTLSSNATLTWADLAPYLNGGPPFCAVGPRGSQWGFRLPKYPPGATYTIGEMADSPSCTYAGRTVALYGLLIHIGDASIDSEHGEVFETYDLPGSNPSKPKQGLRIVGSIVGATVKVLDETGRWTKVETGENGVALLDTFSNKPMAIVVSKKGFLTSSNSVRDPHRYSYNILLKEK